MNSAFLIILLLLAVLIGHNIAKTNEHLNSIQQELATHQTVTPDGYHPPEE
jgi:hypothetical protein